METAVAALNKALSLPQPAVPTVQTRLVTEIPGSRVRVYTLNTDYNDSKAIVGSDLVQAEPVCNVPMRADFEGPLWHFDKTPWTMCSESASSTIFTILSSHCYTNSMGTLLPINLKLPKVYKSKTKLYFPHKMQSSYALQNVLEQVL